MEDNSWPSTKIKEIIDMYELLKGTNLTPVFSDGGVDCYRVTGREYLNRYYVVSEEGTRNLLNKPEIVGFDVYNCMLKPTTRMMKYFKSEGLVNSANILSILRGALNYPLEESCYREKIRVHDISFLSSERVFHEAEIAGLEIKYSKLALVPDSTLLIGDILATGDTLVHCLRYVTDHYRKHGAKLKNIILFTIGGTKGIEIMERLTKEFREFWPEFEGFIGVYYEGIFNCYQDKGVAGIQLPNVDFYWADGALAPAYRKQSLSSRDVLFEKCIIYDGGARRYEIADHVKEVLEYWEEVEELADRIDFKAFTDERLGYATPVSKADWLHYNFYEEIDPAVTDELYAQETAYVKSLEGVTLKEIAKERIQQITTALRKYMI